MTLKGKKLGKTVLMDIEPPVKDGTELEVCVPLDSVEIQEWWEAQGQALMNVGHHPDFGENIEKIRAEWDPAQF